MAGAGEPQSGGEGSSARVVFTARLSELWATAGNPTLQRVAEATAIRMRSASVPARNRPASLQRISDWRSGRALPSRFESFEPVLLTLIGLAQATSEDVRPDLTNRLVWKRLWRAAQESASVPDKRAVPPLRHRDAPPRPRVRTALRRDIDTFIGRDADVRRILDAAGTSRILAVHTIDGMAGVGKTALVTRAAHQLSERFPDGHFFVDLNAHTPGQSPAEPSEVLARLLTDLGIHPGQLPDTLEGRRNLWRDRTADQRVLLVLDDAHDHTQIEPLLPVGGGCLTLITSRRRLIALDGALPLSLDVLDPDTAADMFCALAHRVPADADRAAVAEIVRLCGYLPLAIVLLAGRLAHHRAWTIAGLAAEFASAQDRLGELDAGQRAVRAAFTTSYNALPDDLRRLFRRLGLHPGPDLDVYAAAALADVPVATARRALDALYTDHLIDEIAPGRYRFHDLVREFASTLACTDPATETSAALDRLLDYYQYAAHLAGGADSRRSEPARQATSIAAPDFPNHASALSWIQLERPNLRASLEHAAAHDQLLRVIALINALAAEVRLAGNGSFAIAVHERGSVPGGSGNDRLARAYAIKDFGATSLVSDDYAWAAERLERVLASHTHFEDPAIEAAALRTLARARYLAGHNPPAIDALHRARKIYHALDRPTEEAAVLSALGWVAYLIDEYRESAGLLRQALAMQRDLGAASGEASTLVKLGWLTYLTEDPQPAFDLLARAVEIYREIGHRSGEASALSVLAWVHVLERDFTPAFAMADRMLDCYREMGIRSGEAFGLINIGFAHHELGDLPAAIETLRQAREIYRDMGNLPGEASALNILGKALCAVGDTGHAAEVLRQALEIFRHIGHRAGEAQSLELIAALPTDRFAGFEHGMYQ
ncbi:tetratricopeptide repeat protein [Nocardia sp. NPDC051030]|uniref:ATP-binding protein n=1 Tax=Nocardia sp. NPDC051030 TaxID=3155162 RepID=UPI003413B778